jgi:hypothetical protein
MTDVNVEILDNYRNDWMLKWVMGNRDMPQIDEKIIMTSFMKEKLEDLKGKFVDVVCKESRYFIPHQLPQRQKMSSIENCIDRLGSREGYQPLDDSSPFGCSAAYGDIGQHHSY